MNSTFKFSIPLNSFSPFIRWFLKNLIKILILKIFIGIVIFEIASSTYVNFNHLES